MSRTIIDSAYGTTKKLREYLLDKKEPSFLSVVEDNLRKNLLLSAASFFESELKEGLLTFTATHANNNELITSFIKNKALERQYHTFFDWNSRNANNFFKLFGKNFHEFMNDNVKKDDNLRDSIEAFIELGAIRNKLVHQNFATFPLEKTVDEIYDLYKRGKVFLDILPEKFDIYLQSLNKKV